MAGSARRLVLLRITRCRAARWRGRSGLEAWWWWSPARIPIEARRGAGVSHAAAGNVLKCMQPALCGRPCVEDASFTLLFVGAFLQFASAAALLFRRNRRGHPPAPVGVRVCTVGLVCARRRRRRRRVLALRFYCRRRKYTSGKQRDAGAPTQQQWDDAPQQPARAPPSSVASPTVAGGGFGGGS